MNFKLKRVTRTPNSEQLFALSFDQLDREGEPVQFAQIDVHYFDDQIVGTLLVSLDFADGYRASQGGGTRGQAALDEVITAVLAELSEPVGVSATYAFEVYYTRLQDQGFFSNYGDEGDDETDEDMEYEQTFEEYVEEVDTAPHGGETQQPGRDDDFSRKLRER
jgi:hypothetical protein